jgi:hypothetical protein
MFLSALASFIFIWNFSKIKNFLNKKIRNFQKKPTNI